jgi:threonylcarbamoyladenosine tRNA methylthiotransferase MtaB
LRFDSTTSKTRARIAFTTLGCRVNQYDTQALKEQAEKASLQTVPFEEPADIYVINTCTVTAAADAEGRMLVRRAKGKNPGSFVVVTGCLAQDRPQEMAELAGVDLVVGNAEKSRLLNKIVQTYFRDEAVTDFPLSILHSPLSPWVGGISRFDGHQRATIKVQDGCNFGCSFCLVPRVRGKMISRPELEIVEEGKRLAQTGVRELVLAGIQLSSYGRDLGLRAPEPRLAPVVEKLLAIPGIRRVRLSSYGVADFEEALLPLWQSRTGLCTHIHLPLQSGDAGVLKAMRRPYSLDRYRRTVEKVRKANARIGLTTDILVGFPGETDKAFENTFGRIREFGFIDFHPFPYSERPHTPGEKMIPKTAPAILRERMNRIWEFKKERLALSAHEFLGRECRVIVERHDQERQAGLTDEGFRVLFPKKEGWLGKEAHVKVIGVEAGAALAEWLETVNAS